MMLAKRIIAIALSFAMTAMLAGCEVGPKSDTKGDGSTPSQATVSAPPLEFATMDDPELLRYMEDSVYADLEADLGEDYSIENVTAIYVPFASNEYKQELAFNSQENVYFGYTLADLDHQFQGSRYIFTADESGNTSVKEFEAYDDAYDQAIDNVAVGMGCILVCVTVTIISGAVGATPVSTLFAVAAKTGTKAALSNGVISGLSSGVVKAIETNGDMNAVVREAALRGSESFKWCAITGILAGGVSEASALRNASKAAEAAKDGTTTAKPVPTPNESENTALQKYGGEPQVTFLDGERVPYGMKGATRPDIVRTVGRNLEAIEVKNYDLANNASGLYSELEREISARVANLPEGSLQRIVLDVTGRGYDNALIEAIEQGIWTKLDPIYPNIPIDIIR